MKRRTTSSHTRSFAGGPTVRRCRSPRSPPPSREITGGTPKATFWELQATFGSERDTLGGAGFPGARHLFRRFDSDTPHEPHETIDLLAAANTSSARGPFYPWLHGTRLRDPDNVFSFDNGHLQISGEDLGYLATRKSYRDYHLAIEYRWGARNHGERIGKARDAGIFLHATGPDGNSHDGDGAFQSAIECQIMEGAVGDLMLIRGKDGAGKLIPMSIHTTVAAKPDADGWADL